jgi:hypothetical protein
VGALSGSQLIRQFSSLQRRGPAAAALLGCRVTCRKDAHAGKSVTGNISETCSLTI